MHSPRDVAELLDVEYKLLNYHLFVTPPTTRYTVFQISKKSGGTREISAPATALKIIQRKLNTVLQAVYEPKPSVHGFTQAKSIRSNAERHVRKKFVFNIDLKDFFPSINFGRVRGMFMAWPYNLSPQVATVLAQICCFNDQLPQGAPTSPVVSNMICGKMDSELQKLAKGNRCFYTRYADDLTFSTTMPFFPTSLATRNLSDAGDGLRLGPDLAQVINQNGFEVNPAKIRLRTNARRQEVTGLTTNRFPNVRRNFVRQIRAMLYAWDKFGLDSAEEEFRKKHDYKHRSPYKGLPSFKAVVKGKIEYLGMIRGRSDSIYLRFADQANALDPGLFRVDPVAISEIEQLKSATIMTEGPTDILHLRKALDWLGAKGQFANLLLAFDNGPLTDSIGDSELLQFCRQASKQPQLRPTICIFDRDNPRILRDVESEGGGFKNWGSNVFSFALPVPEHRQETPEVCIELYYRDHEIMRTSSQGRRLFLSNEFDRATGRHLTDGNLSCWNRNKVSGPRLTIIDDEVFNPQNENVALPKSDFADLVASGSPGFDDFSFDEFAKVFEIVSSVISGRL